MRCSGLTSLLRAPPLPPQSHKFLASRSNLTRSSRCSSPASRPGPALNLAPLSTSPRQSASSCGARPGPRARPHPRGREARGFGLPACRLDPATVCARMPPPLSRVPHTRPQRPGARLVSALQTLFALPPYHTPQPTHLRHTHHIYRPPPSCISCPRPNGQVFCTRGLISALRFSVAGRVKALLWALLESQSADTRLLVGTMDLHACWVLGRDPCALWMELTQRSLILITRSDHAPAWPCELLRYQKMCVRS